MINSGIKRNIDTVISTLNTKADTNLANSARATEIASIAESAASAANSANVVAQAASELISTSLPTKVNKFGDTINGNLVVDGDMIVTGTINATITGSSDSAMFAVKDSNGNVIVDTYATKNDIIGIVRSVNGVNADVEGNVTLAIVATTGSYNDLSDKPTISSATVSQKGTRASTGNWTISSLTVNKPLFIAIKFSNTPNPHVRIGATSGVHNSFNTTNSSYQIMLGVGSSDEGSSSNVAMFIPSSTSVVLNVSELQNASLIAYQ